MLPDVNRARVTTIDLQLILNDFLNSHSKGEKCYTLPETDTVLRQDDLPADARVLWARLDDPTTKEDALREAAAVIDELAALLTLLGTDDAPVPSPALAARIAAAQAAIAAAIAEPHARNLIVGIESDTYRPVARGKEPIHTFAYDAFFPKPDAAE